jgi:5-amino-6-(5-phosphoribosylamino)uracil reductase
MRQPGPPSGLRVVSINPSQWRTRPQPHVVLNMAMTADGKIATANREISSFGSRFDHRNLYSIRSQADAVLCGARTVQAEDADLGVGPEEFRRARLRRGLAVENSRVVVSSSGSVDPSGRVFHESTTPTLVFVSSRALRKLGSLGDLNAECCVCGTERVDLKAALAWLRETYQAKRVVCEGGAELNDSMFRAELVDEIFLTVCPLVFGGRTAPTISEGTGFARLGDAAQFELVSIRRVEGEAFLHYRRRVGKSSPPSRP